MHITGRTGLTSIPPNPHGIQDYNYCPKNLILNLALQHNITGNPMEQSTPELPAITEACIRQLLSDLKLPIALAIEPFKAAAAYHSIYVVKYPEQSTSTISINQSISTQRNRDLVLRVAGNSLPQTKTSNEVAVMQWIRQNTNVPIPAMIASDSSNDNALGHEYTLMERASGISVDRIYDSLNLGAKEKLVEQLAKIVFELHRHSWSHVGGLATSLTGEISPGPVLEETFWQSHTLLKFWGSGRTLDELNISGPYPDYVTYVVAHISKYIYAIKAHPKLQDMRASVSLIVEFQRCVTARASTLNDARYVLAHKDLHFANILCDPETYEVTAILDFEFACVVPAFAWDPVRAFLWNAQYAPESKTEKATLWESFERTCRSNYPSVLEDIQPNKTQELVVKALSHLRAIIEVSIMGGNEQKLSEWKMVFESAVKDLRP